MSTKEPLSDVAVNSYEATVPIDSSVFNTYDEAELAVRETVARSITTQVDELDPDDAPYVSTQVSINESALEDAYNDETVGIITVQTVTELAVIDDE